MSGHENLTAIRSPVLTGGGSCAAYLCLEDGIPIRPAGFCNVNALFEINTEQAQSIEVIRGPGNALYGSNALHRIVNVLLPLPGPGRASRVAVEVGANDYVRRRAILPFRRSSGWVYHIAPKLSLGYRLRDSAQLYAVFARGFRAPQAVDTAPRWLGSLEFDWTPFERLHAGLQLTSIGEYYVDAENKFRYPGRGREFFAEIQYLTTKESL